MFFCQLENMLRLLIEAKPKEKGKLKNSPTEDTLWKPPHPDRTLSIQIAWMVLGDFGYNLQLHKSYVDTEGIFSCHIQGDMLLCTAPERIRQGVNCFSGLTSVFVRLIQCFG